MLSFWLCFLSFFYTVNSFSTEEKQEEEIKCYSCKEIVMTIPKNNENNYTVEKPFASLSCIFACGCNSFFLCKDCYEKKKKKMAKCPICKKKCNNENNEFENNEFDENDENDDYHLNAYIKTNPLATYSYFYNCECKGLICKECYKGCIKCPTCEKFKNEENKFDAKNKENNHNAMDEENKKIKDQKNCCQICTEYIENCISNCIYPQ